MFTPFIQIVAKTLNPISTLLNLGCFLWTVFLLTCLVSNCVHIFGGSYLNCLLVTAFNIHVGFIGAKTNCGIAHILGILLMNS